MKKPMSQTHSDIQIPEYINKLFGKKTIPFNDYDLLEKISRSADFECVIFIMETNLQEYIIKNGINEKSKEITFVISMLKGFNTWCNVLWENGANQLSIAFNSQKDNLRLRFELQQSLIEIERLKKEINFNSNC